MDKWILIKLNLVNNYKNCIFGNRDFEVSSCNSSDRRLAIFAIINRVKICSVFGERVRAGKGSRKGGMGIPARISLISILLGMLVMPKMGGLERKLLKFMEINVGEENSGEGR